MKNETLLNKSIQNLICAKTLYENLAQDEVYLNYVGYHLQQAVELAIKYNLEMNGVEYQKTHDITQLINLAKENNVDIKITEYIDEHSEMFTVWESKTRYILNYKLESIKIKKALEEVEKYLSFIEQEQFKTENEDDIQEDKKEE